MIDLVYVFDVHILDFLGGGGYVGCLYVFYLRLKRKSNQQKAENLSVRNRLLQLHAKCTLQQTP